MTKFPLILAMAAFLAAGAHAQGAGSAVTVSTDPAKIAAIEQHAQELKARQAGARSPATQPAKKKSHHKTQHHASTKAPAKG